MKLKMNEMNKLYKIVLTKTLMDFNKRLLNRGQRMTFYAQNANCSQIFLRSLTMNFMHTLKIITLKPAEMTFTSTFSTFNDFHPPPLR